MSAVKVVLDSSVLVSRFLNPVPGGAAFDLLEHIRTGTCEAFVFQAILREVESVLLRSRIRRRYEFDDQEVQRYSQELTRIATVLDPKPVVRAVRDPNDDVVLDCAIAAGAAYLVTRDDDLLSLERFRDVRILKPEELLHLLRGKHP